MQSRAQNRAITTKHHIQPARQPTTIICINNNNTKYIVTFAEWRRKDVKLAILFSWFFTLNTIYRKAHFSVDNKMWIVHLFNDLSHKDPCMWIRLFSFSLSVAQYCWIRHFYGMNGMRIFNVFRLFSEQEVFLVTFDLFMRCLKWTPQNGD